MSLVLTAAALLAPAQDPAQDAPKFEVIALEHAVAGEAAPTIAAAAPGSKVMAGARTNSLLVMAAPDAMPAIKDAIVALDAPVASQGSPGDLFPAPSDDLVIAVGEGGASWKMMDLVQEYARLTNQHIQVQDDTRQYLESTATGLTRSVVVPKAEVQTFFEGLLVENHFVMTVIRESDPRLLGITSLNTSGRNVLRAKAHFVPEQELGAWRGHASVLIQTVVHLPNTDVRQLSNSMRTMITDTNTQQMLPAGNSNSMVLVGYATTVADLADMLRIVDDASAKEAQSPTYRRFALKNAVAADVAPLIEDLLDAANNRGRAVTQGGPPPVPSARVVADPRTNALVVMCLPVDLPRVEELVALFDAKQD